MYTEKDGGTLFESCIQACIRCAQTCDEAYIACMNGPDLAFRGQLINLLADCSGICGLCGFMLRRSSLYSRDVCVLCARICARCAAECGLFRDEHCVKCAEECHTCAAACKISVEMQE